MTSPSSSAGYARSTLAAGRSAARAGEATCARTTPGCRPASPPARNCWTSRGCAGCGSSLRELPRGPGGDVMSHGDLIPGNVLVVRRAPGRDPRRRRAGTCRPGAGSGGGLAPARGRPAAAAARRPRLRRPGVGTRQGVGVRAGHGAGLVLRGEQPGDEPDGHAHLAAHPGFDLLQRRRLVMWRLGAGHRPRRRRAGRP